MNLHFKYIVLSICFLISYFDVFAQDIIAEKQITKKAIHPRFREWVSPSNSKIVDMNPCALLWPAENKPVKYKVKLSQYSTFPSDNTIESDVIEWSVFTPHKKLNAGTWFWKYCIIKSDKEVWSEVFYFVISDQSYVFETPTIKEFLEKCLSINHHRLFVSQSELVNFRERNKSNKETLAICKRADKQLSEPYIVEAPTRPRDTTGLSDSEKKVMMVFMYHRFGDKLKEPIKDLSLAYLLTGKEHYIKTAINQALHASKMDPKGSATSEDFNSASVMLAMAIAYDTGYSYMTDEERKELLAAIKKRGDYFYKQYVNRFETHSMDNHVWQHTLRRFCMTSIAVLGDLPEAEKWLSYCYEVWCCRFPILGGNDGGWHDGNSYFQVNFETFIYMPFTFSRFSGVNFFDIPYYKNLSKYLIYSFPPGSFATGFGDNAETMKRPTKSYWGFADALARELGDPYARWYSDILTNNRDEILFKSANFTLYRLLTAKGKTDTKAESPKNLPQSLLFRDAGFALMHNDVTDAPNDVMINFTALPFGSTGHAHAAHNGFGVNVGGEQMFGGSGHYSNFTDHHTLKHYRTRGHNTILVDGMAQVIGENGYGWVARYENTDNFTYVLGDATHAYGDMKTEFWVDRMKQFGVDYTKENGFGNPNVERFRRHFVFLRPNIIVIYDELEAKNPSIWTWLLHSYNPMKLGDRQNVILGENKYAKSRVDIFTSKKIGTSITNEFFSPAINWKQRGGEDGTRAYEYAKHWHAEVSTTAKSKAIRFLSVIRIDQENNEKPLSDLYYKNGKVNIGHWSIEAVMDENKPAFLSIINVDGDQINYSDQNNIKGSTVIKIKGKQLSELIDVLPSAIH